MLDKSEKSDPVSNGDRCKQQSLEQYCQSLRKWVAEVNCWKDFHQYNTFVSAYQSRAEYFHHYSTSEDLRHRRPGQTDNEPNVAFNGVRQVGDFSAPVPSSAREVTVVRNANGSTVLSAQFVLASYVRRFFAEFIDFIFAFFIKLMIIFYLVEMEVIDLSRFDKLLGNEADLQTLVDVTQELFPLELLGKLFCSLLEALCISQSFLPRYSGQTPGKYLMHVRVIDCSSVSYIAGGSPNSVRVTGVVSVPFKAALLRSILKNVLINSLVPFSTVAFAFNHNRAIYDLLAGTIVIED